MITLRASDFPINSTRTDGGDGYSNDGDGDNNDDGEEDKNECYTTVNHRR